MLARAVETLVHDPLVQYLVLMVGQHEKAESKQRKEGSGVSQFLSYPCLQWPNCLPLDASFQWYGLNLPKQCHSWDANFWHILLWRMFKIQNMAVTMSFVLYFYFLLHCSWALQCNVDRIHRSSQSSSL